MAEKVILIADAGIDAAFAVALALSDPELEVLALAASAGNVGHTQATRNAYTIVEQIDPPRRPRVGTAPPEDYDIDNAALHGKDGLGGADLPCAMPAHTHPSDKLITDTLRQYPGEVAVAVMGPCTVLARALDRDPEAAKMISRLVVVGGTRHEPGDAGPVSEFHFACDPVSAKKVLECGASVTLLPLDATKKMLFSPGDVRNLGLSGTPTGDFLREIVPHLLSPTASLFGVEGVYLNDALAVVALARPDLLIVKPAAVDVETRGERTKGMSVFDSRWATEARPNVDVVTDFDVNAAREYIRGRLSGEG